MPIETLHLISSKSAIVTDCDTCMEVLYETDLADFSNIRVAETLANLHIARTAREGREHQVQIVIYHTPKTK